jgi:hypothetical protein
MAEGAAADTLQVGAELVLELGYRDLFHLAYSQIDPVN